MRENKIVGIKGAYRSFPFPENEEYSLLDNVSQDDGSANAYIQSSVCGIVKPAHCNIYNYIKKQNKKILVLEQPVFRKNLSLNDLNNFYFRLGLWHYAYNLGDFKNKKSPDDRWKIIQNEQDIEVKPWRNSGEYILILLQNPIDTSLNSLIKKYKTYPKWLDDTISQIRKFSDQEIVIRKHPGFIKSGRFNNLNFLTEKYRRVSFSKNIHGGNITNGGDNLYKDFSCAKLVVGYNSNSLVEAICEGIPTVTLSEEGFSYPVSYKEINKKILNTKCDIDRKQWLYDCSYAQWKMSEINQGIPHRRLFNET